MKKLLASLIVSLLLLSVCIVAAVPASAADGVNYDDWLIFDGAIVEYCGSDAEVVVPTVDADGLPITKIEGSAFAGSQATPNTTLEKVVIPEGITEIGGCAFEYCENLIEVSLPYSLEKAGHSLFRYCNLTEIKIPGNLKEIPSDFTTGCPISEFVISYGVEVFAHGSITVGAGCEEIIFPKSVYEIQGRAACYLKNDAGDANGRLEFYILNDDCKIGYSDGSEQWYKRWNGAERGAAFEVPTNFNYDPVWYSKFTQMHIYGLDGGNIQQYVKDFMSNGDKPWEYAVFHGIEKSEIDEKNQWCKDNAVAKPDETKKDDDEDNDKSNKDDEDDDNGSSNKKNNNNAASSGIDSTTLILIIAIAGGFFLLIIIVVVVLVIVMGSKKKKKKKKKAKVEAPVEEAVAEEVPVEEAAEEKGEEE